MARVRSLGTNEGNWAENRISSLGPGSVPGMSGTLNCLLLMIAVWTDSGQLSKGTPILGPSFLLYILAMLLTCDDL